MHRSRALTSALCNPGRCYSQRTRCLSTTGPFASFISDIKVPESVATSESVEETPRNAPRLSLLGDIEIPSSIPSKSPTSLFATRAAQRQKRLQAEARVTEIESTVRKTPEPASPPPRSVISRASQRSHVKDEERRSSGGPLRPQTDANIRQRRPYNAVAKSAPVDYRQKERSRSARPRRDTEETLPDGGVELGETAVPSVLHADFNETDLSELFNSPVPAPSIARSSVAQSHIDARMQLLKEHAGDYSQYLPRDTDPTTLTERCWIEAEAHRCGADAGSRS
ncbi:hypothetical protein M405DRAFT_930958 [Rhizopogon salebrosus TDB-379]|nr:hypothetical protein M405DRAFT_930958 [Rhizopogon salebrosus TDB-379]